MKAQTIHMKAYELGVVNLYIKLRVNNNPFAESLFKTCKYRPNWSTQDFKGLDEVDGWVMTFAR